MTILYFTASGNSLAVAKEIGGNLVSIPQAIKQERYEFEDDKIGIICPIYGFNLPKVVRRFLDRVILKTEHLFIVGTYGNMYGSFPKKVKKHLSKSGKIASYINAIKMVDNALHAGFEIKKQLETLPNKKVGEHLAKIKADIYENKKHIMPHANRILSAIVTLFTPLLDKMTGSKMLRIDSAACTKCKTCQKVCPVNNIAVSDKVDIGKNCELCLACLHNCPKKAIHIKMEKSNERFRNEAVTLKEIIDSNGQNQEQI